MRARFLTGALLIVALGQAGVASASVLIDDFAGTTLDTGKWTVVNGTPTVGGSVLSLTGSDWATRGSVKSVASFDTGVEYAVATTPTGRTYLGVATADGLSNFLIRTDGTNDTYPQYAAEIWNDGMATQDSPTFSISAGDVLGLSYTTTTAGFYKNGSLVWSTDTIGLRAPSASILMAAGGQADTAPNSIGIGSVSHITPEPGTLVLATTGLLGLLAYAWRKRK